MSICTTDAIVLNRYVLGDSSLLVTVYTRDFGKIKMVARGARKSKNQRAFALEPFTHITITFRRKAHRDLQTLSQVDVATVFRRLSEDLTRMSYAGAVAELSNRLIIGEEPSVSIFDLILETLDQLNRHPPEAGEVLFWGFQLRFATAFGYAPQFERCAGCNQPMDEREVRFSPALGGIVCPQCFGQDTNAFSVSLGTVKLLTRLQHLPLERLPRFKASRLSQREIIHIIRSFFMYHMEDARELKSLKFLQSLDLEHEPAQNPASES